MKDKIKWIVFDVGNVLLDIDLEAPVNYYLGKTGVSRETLKEFFLESYRGSSPPSTHELYQTGKLSTAEYLKELSKILNDKLSIEELKKSIDLVLKSERQNVLEILKTLKENYKIACFSNTTPLHWDKLKTYCEYFNYLDAELTSFGLGAAKPKLDAYKKMLLSLQAEASEVLFIDDSEKNVSSAKILRINALRYTDFETFKKDISFL